MIYGYARVSTTEQAADDKSSLSAQDRIIRGKAMGKGWEDPVMFVDAGVSGATPLHKRPTGAKLVSVLRKGDTLIVAKMDRLFRSLADAAATADRFRAEGIDLIIADMGDDPVTQNGAAKFFFGVMAAAAEFERSRIAERMAEGKRGKRARGGHAGGVAPYGWRIVGEGRGARLVVDAGEQAAISMARKLEQTGRPWMWISGEMAKHGFVSRSGKPFVAQQLIRMVAGEPRREVA